MNTIDIDLLCCIPSDDNCVARGRGAINKGAAVSSPSSSVTISQYSAQRHSDTDTLPHSTILQVSTLETAMRKLKCPSVLSSNMYILCDYGCL